MPESRLSSPRYSSLFSFDASAQPLLELFPEFEAVIRIPDQFCELLFDNTLDKAAQLIFIQRGSD
jgi:hypothetical protein